MQALTCQPSQKELDEKEGYQACIDGWDRGEAVWLSNPYPFDEDKARGWNQALKNINRRVNKIMAFHGTDRRANNHV